MNAAYDHLLQAVADACKRYYGGRLVSLAVFGSVGRGTARHDSDVDLLIVADGLPDGRMARVDEFGRIEAGLSETLASMRSHGIETSLSPVIKSREEIRQRSPLMLDMTEDARCLYDRDDFLRAELAALRARLGELGARRIWRGNAWFWDLKPDFRPGEVIEL